MRLTANIILHSIVGGNFSQPFVRIRRRCRFTDGAVRKYLLVLHGVLPVGVHSVRGAAGLGKN